MRVIDIQNSDRINREPDEYKIITSSRNFSEQGFLIKKIELRLYREKVDKKLGTYSLITSLVETDRGSVEMIYDEGFRGENALNESAEFLIKNLGLSSLVLRSLISLKNELKEN